MKVNGFVEHVDLQAIETLININIYKDPELRTDSVYLFWSYKRHITYI
jgi:hypothetical protein